MPRYAVGAGSSLTVQARSTIHDTKTVWSSVKGDVNADPATLATTGATAVFEVDMTQFDAGDFLRNRKLRKDFDMDANPKATFTLTGLKDVVGDGGTFRAKAEGVLRWRGKEVPLVVDGEGTLDGAKLAATGKFELDIRKLGMSAPRFLMFKMEDEVTVMVKLAGTVAP
ncbi:MAG: YceI family protein [Kofleriaceae bacterium]|nr:MAG: YceI family protein [Kofleriaceae bacterium]MBZ0236427.1 YceI family protein [Kofleriaceae bacterium]